MLVRSFVEILLYFFSLFYEDAVRQGAIVKNEFISNAMLRGYSVTDPGMN